MDWYKDDGAYRKWKAFHEQAQRQSISAISYFYPTVNVPPEITVRAEAAALVADIKAHLFDAPDYEI